MQSKLTLFLKRLTLFIVDTLYPPSHDQILIRKTHPNAAIPCITLTVEKDWVSLLPYRDPLVRALIHEAKFHNNIKAQRILGRVLEHSLGAYTEHIIIPIPLSKARERERGHNQVISILNATTSYRDHVHKNILVRKRHTAPQASLDKTKRVTNLTRAFSVKNTELLSGKDILIIDDVVTTGTTLRSARAALSVHSPTSITCLALAH